MWDVIGKEPSPEDKAHEAVLRELVGGPEVEAFYGYITQFHDAEIDELRLELSQPSLMRLRYWRYENGLIADRQLVSLKMRRIYDVQLCDLEPYSIIYSLRFSRTDNPGITVTIESTLGVGGSIRAEELSLEVVPA